MKRFFLLFILTTLCQIVNSQDLKPVNLRCEYLVNPEAVDVSAPRLSWFNEIINSDKLGECQTAWQIQVATDMELLEKDNPDMWDSGKQKGESVPYRLYGGKELNPATKYWWRVRIWDSQDHVSSWSSYHFWATGMMGQWKAQWIGAPWNNEEPRDIVKGKSLCELYPNVTDLQKLQMVAPSTPAPLFKKEFNISKPVYSARLYTTGLGYFEAYFNGKMVSDQMFVPNQTDYTFRSEMDKRRLPLHINPTGMSVMYLGFDLTKWIQPGRNILECLLGNGFFNSVNVWIAGYGSPRMIAQLEIVYKDGAHETIVSDCTWKVQESPIRSNDVYAGEIYDATKIDSKWQDVVPVKAPAGKLTAQTGPSDKIMEKVHPVSIEKQSSGNFIVKFPEEISGRIKLSNINARKGDTIKISFLNGSVSDYDYNGTITYISNGDKNESYTSRFCWFVYDAAVITNWPSEELKKEDVLSEVIYSDVPEISSFECSNKMIDSLQKMWIRTQKNNMHGSVPTDCPHRERGPYTGDGQLTSAMVMNNFDARAFYLKWISDIMNTQDRNTGYVPNSAPWEPGCGGGVAWGAAMTLLPWEYYLAYGDKKLLADCYEAMKAQTDYMGLWKTREGTMRSNVNNMYIMNLGEHVPPFTSPDQEFIHTYMWMECCETVARAAAVLGNQKDVDLYEDIAGDILGAFMAKYYNYRIGSYGKDECDIIALHMRVIEEEKVIEDLKKNLDSHDGHILTGYVGTRIFLETLSQYNLNDEAYKALTAKGYPGYAHMLESGSTTMWEQWDGKHSHDHPGLGSGLVWLYRYLTGVKIDPESPAYKHFEVSPYIPKDMHHASYCLQTVYGHLKSGWTIDGNLFKMEIIVPEGCTCTLVWPIKGAKVQGKGIQKTDKPDTYILLSGKNVIQSKR